MKNPRLVKALKEMEDARKSSLGSPSISAGSAYWSAVDSANLLAKLSAVDSAYWSFKTNKNEALKILKEKLNEKN